VEEGKKVLGLDEEDIGRPKRGDLRRAAIGRVVWRLTAAVPDAWIAERFRFRSAANSNQQIRNIAHIPRKSLAREIREWSHRFDAKMDT